MTPTRNLSLLAVAAIRQIERLRLIALDAQTQLGVARDRRVAYAVIEAVNLWSEYVCSYYLSLRLDPTLVSGIRVTTTALCVRSHGCPAGPFATWSVDEAIAHAINRGRAKRFVSSVPAPNWGPMEEPRWYRRDVLIDLVNEFGSSNRTDVATALSVSTRLFEDLPVFRNFFAHRSERTRNPTITLASQNAVSSLLRPTEVLLSRSLGRPQPLLVDWLDDLRGVIDLLVA